MTQEGDLSPKNPALSGIFTKIVEINHSDAAHDYAKMMEKIGYTNTLIHELTHVANDNDSHCAQNIDTCIWRSTINGHFYGYDKRTGEFYVKFPDKTTWWKNPITYKHEGRLYHYRSPWHSLDEINAMRRSMGHNEFQAP